MRLDIEGLDNVQIDYYTTNVVMMMIMMMYMVDEDGTRSVECTGGREYKNRYIKVVERFNFYRARIKTKKNTMTEPR
jgi:hypothetical protein